MLLSPGITSLSNEPRRSSQPLGPRFILRNNPDAPNETVTKRGTDEIREHLKHLGPSNLASRPRQTRYQNVKIKAPGVSPTRSGITVSDSGRRFSTEPQRRSSELLSIDTAIGASAIGFDPKDGMRTVRQGYGTIDQPPDSPVVDSASKGTQADLGIDTAQLIMPTEHERRSDTPASTPSRTPNRSKPSSIHSYETHPVDHQKGPSRISAPIHGPARSGSITEQVIDVNGVRKVVLHAPSSSSSSDTERMTTRSPPSPLSQDGLSHEQAVESEPTDDASARLIKKKRRRRKNQKHSGHDNERKPLLPK